MLRHPATRRIVLLGLSLSLVASCQQSSPVSPLASGGFSQDNIEQSKSKKRHKPLLEILMADAKMKRRQYKVQGVSAPSTWLPYETFVGSAQADGYVDATGQDARFSYTMGLDADANGNLYVADYGSYVRKVNPDAQVTTAARIEQAEDVAVGANGEVFIAESATHAIHKIAADGAVSPVAGGAKRDEDGYPDIGYADGMSVSAEFAYPGGIAVDMSGNIYVADSFNDCIRKITPDGTVATIAGTPPTGQDNDRSRNYGYQDGPRLEAKFDTPTDIAVDRGGNVFVADYNNDCIRKISPDGIVTTFAGGKTNEFGEPIEGFHDGVGSEAEFTGPWKLDFDRDGNLLVVDAATVRKISAEGRVTTIVGTADGEYWGNDYQLNGVAAAPDGGLFISTRTRVLKAGGVKPSPSPSPSPSPTYLDLKAAPAFSPNGDGNKDSAAVKIEAQGLWSLEVVGHPGELGKAPVDKTGNKTFPWDGTVNDIILPDGKYTLRLTAGGEVKTAEVFIDTTAPEFDVAIDNTPVSGLAAGVIKSVVPEFKLTIKDDLSKNSDSSSVDLSFSRRGDGLTPPIKEAKSIDNIDDKSYIFKYAVPFENETLLYLGDQFIDIGVSDLAGNKAQKRISYSVGERDFYSGLPDGPGPDAYRVNFIQEPKTYPLPDKYNKPGYAVRKVPYQDFVKKVPGNAPGPNYYMYLIRATPIAGAITIVFFDQELNDLKEFILRGVNIVHTEFGDIHIPQERVEHAISEHPELDKETIHDGIAAINLSTQNRGRFEFWKNPTPQGKLLAEGL